MNTSKALNILLAVALVILSIKIAFFSENHAPQANGSEENVEAAATEDKTDIPPDSIVRIGEYDWHTISPAAINRDPFTLLGHDWMGLAVGRKGDMNAMTIAWGTLGRLWNRDVMIVYVSSSRYTHSFMDRFEDFTVMGFPESQPESLHYIGTHSGRDDADKLTKAGLTTAFTSLGNPIFNEANLAIECRTIYKAPFDPSYIDPQVRKFHDNGTGIHTMYIGEILHVYAK